MLLINLQITLEDKIENHEDFKIKFYINKLFILQMKQNEIDNRRNISS
jgi:hypothetical protein